MNQEERLEIQAWLDGELPPQRTSQIVQSAQTSPEAENLTAELRAVSDALGAAETEAELGEPREFYWSQIELQIEAEEPLPATAEPVLAPSPMSNLMRWVVPVGSLAAIFALIITFGTISNTQDDVYFGSDAVTNPGSTDEPTQQANPTGRTESAGMLEDPQPNNNALEIFQFGKDSRNLTDPEDPNSLPESIENPD